MVHFSEFCLSSTDTCFAVKRYQLDSGVMNKVNSQDSLHTYQCQALRAAQGDGCQVLNPQQKEGGVQQ